MMRSRDQNRPLASTYQYPPLHLVYRLQGPPAWHSGLQAELREKILTLMPHDVRESYRALLQDDRDLEADAQLAVQWIDRHGEAAGFQPPNVTERLRAIGPSGYLQGLALSPVQLFNLAGNHFDPRALGHRMLQPLFALTQQPLPRQHPFPSPANVLKLYAELRAHLPTTYAQANLCLEEGPFPLDLVPALQATPLSLP